MVRKDVTLERLDDQIAACDPSVEGRVPHEHATWASAPEEAARRAAGKEPAT